VTAEMVLELGEGAALYVNDCAMTVNKYKTAVGGDTITAAEEEISAGTYTSGGTVGLIGVETEVDGGHDCGGNLLADTSVTYPVQRRSDDTANQNVYKTSGDTAAAAATDMGVSFQRGSAVGDITTAHTKAASDPLVTAAASVLAVVTTGGSETTTITTVGANVGSAATGDKFYFHTYGPFAVDTVTAGTDTDDLVFNGVAKQEAITQHFGTAVAATANIHMTTNRGAADAAVTTAKALLIGGRRYRVKAVSGTAVTLSETFAGGQLRQVCAACVTAQDDTNLQLSVNKRISGIPLGALVGTSTKLNLDNFAMVTEKVAEANPQIIKVGKSANREGTNFFVTGASVTGVTLTDDLYTIQGLSNAGYSYSTITELAGGTTYQYVAQCSNRGACDASTGLCKCFKGYSNDNCDTQNMLAA